MNIDITGLLVVALIIYAIRQNKEVRNLLNGITSFLDNWLEGK